jgi:hypothetical protein
MVEKISRFLRSNLFFWIILGFFFAEASWIALSSHYPMAFDESFHLGVIRLYAHHLSPWWSGQPAGADIFGAVTRDPSYLYHWLMSFPYRLISQVFHSEIQQVIVLRFINIGLFAGGLVMMRKLLLKTTRSKAVINAVLLFFILTPFVPMVAGQINYDNLLFLVLPVTLLLAVQFVDQLRVNKRLDLTRLVVLVMLCLLGSLVKYAFLPVVLVVAVYVLWALYKVYWRANRPLGKELGLAYSRLSVGLKVALVAGLALSAVLFSQRYVVNVVQYHTPLPECNLILGRDQCLQYGPWARNYRSQQTKLQTGVYDKFTPATYTQHWFFVLWRSMFYILNGPDSDYAVGQPLLLPLIVSVSVLMTGLFFLVRYHREIFKHNSPLRLLAVLTLFYPLILFVQNYSDYLHTGQAVAIQGRYLLPILVPLYLLLALGISYGLRQRHNVKLIILILAFALFTQGGGIITYLVRTDDSWYITNST